MTRIAYGSLYKGTEEDIFAFLRYMDADEIWTDTEESAFENRDSLINSLKKGDVIITASIDSCSDGIDDFRIFARKLKEKGVNLLCVANNFELFNYRGVMFVEDIKHEPAHRNEPVYLPRAIIKSKLKLENDKLPASYVPEKHRGRPRKNPLPEAVNTISENTNASLSSETADVLNPPVKRRRGRPRKNPLPEVTPAVLETVIAEETVNVSETVAAAAEFEVIKETEADVQPVKRGRGRPRIHPIVVVDPAMKRKRGRPRKNPIETAEPAVKRGRGRPRKNPLPAVAAAAITAAAAEAAVTEINNTMPEAVQPVKRGRGRPRIHPIVVVDPAMKRKRGRPRKNPIVTEADAAMNKEAAVIPAESTVVQEPQTAVIKRGRGRPRKHPLPVEPVVKRGRGRPRKNPIETTEPAVKRGRGRPRKNPLPEVTPAVPETVIAEETVKVTDTVTTADEMEVIKETQEDVQPVKRGRGRPRIHPIVTVDPAIKRKRGRPRKNPLPDHTEESAVSASEQLSEKIQEVIAAETVTSDQEVVDRTISEETEAASVEKAAEPVKRGRGRPRKTKLEVTSEIKETDEAAEPKQKKTLPASKKRVIRNTRTAGRGTKKISSSSRWSGRTEAENMSLFENCYLRYQKKEINKTQMLIELGCTYPELTALLKKKKKETSMK